MVVSVELIGVAIFVGILLLITLMPRQSHNNEDAATQGKVVWVLDGDTYDVKLSSGKKVRVRILGIDTPELAHNGEPEQPDAQAA
jgi:micrococcal nuclease